MSTEAEREALVENTRRFVAETVSTDQLRHHPGTSSLDKEWWRQGCQAGWTSLLVPDLMDAADLGQCLPTAVAVAHARGASIAPGPFVASAAVAAVLADGVGSSDVQSALEAVIEGTAIIAWCAAQAHFGLGNSRAVTADITPSGFLLRGTLPQVESVSDADALLVIGDTEKGLASFLIAADTPGVSHETRSSIDLSRRFGELRFEDVMLPPSALVGSGPAHEEHVRRVFDAAVLLKCAEIVGIAQRAFEMTLSYASDRFTFGRSVASYQAIKHRLADHALTLHSGAAAVRVAAEELGSMSDWAELASACAAFIGDEVPEAMQDCIQIHGGIGITWEHDMHVLLRRTLVHAMTWGTPTEHRHRLSRIVRTTWEEQSA